MVKPALSCQSHRCWHTVSHRIGSNRKRSEQSTNADQKSIETVFSIAICRQSGDKWQSKTLFLTIFDLRSSIVFTFLIQCSLSGVCVEVYEGAGQHQISSPTI